MTLRKYYVRSIYENTMKHLRGKANGQKLWVSIDESTDVEQRYVAYFVFGILGVEEERLKYYLSNVSVLSKVNHSTMAAFFNDSLQCLWGGQMQYENVLLVVTDAAPYMVKSMNGLKSLYPKMIHVTCLAHGLHRVAEFIRSSYPEVNRLIATGKSMFVKAPHRVQLFRAMNPEVPLPPSQVLTRWGTWLNAAEYYNKFHDEFSSVITVGKEAC